MVDNKRPETIEEKAAAVENWISKISETETVGEMDPNLLREFLETKGANFEISELARISLKKYTNAGRAFAMQSIWGDKYDTFKKWIAEWIPKYEQETLHGRELPKLGKAPNEGETDNRTKNSGMIQFYGEITAFAAGELSFKVFKTYVETRVHNGQIWNKFSNTEDRKRHQVKIVVPTSDGEAIKISSIPPEFPKAAWKELTK